MIKAPVPVYLFCLRNSHNSTRTHNAEAAAKAVKYMNVRFHLDFVFQSVTTTHVHALSPALLTIQLLIGLQYAKQRRKTWSFFARDDVYLGRQRWGGFFLTLLSQHRSSDHYAERTPSPFAVQDRTSSQSAFFQLETPSPCLPRKTFSLVPRPRVPPSEKRSGERSRISWAYSPKVVMTNEIARSVIIT